MFCGIDVSKGKSQACILNKDKRIIYQGEIPHTKEGFEKLEKHLTKETIIGMESTGNYTKTIYYFLKNKHKVFIIDNVQMHNFAKLQFLHVKNDKVDAKMIAEYLMSDYKRVIPAKMDELKDLCRLYHRATKQLIRYKKSFVNQLSIIFPELENISYLKKAKAVPTMLLKYPTPEQIAKAPTQEIYSTLIESLSTKRYFNMEYAEKIKKTAEESVGVKDYPVKCFKHTIKLLLFFQEAVEEIKKDLREGLAKTPYVKLLEVKGYGLVSLSAIVGEVGDIRRFSNYKKFVKYCGLDVSEKQSGKQNSTHCYITKHGNRYLRSMFYNLVLSQIADKNAEFHKFYKRLKEKGKHTTKCMVAVSRKIAVRTYFDMMRCHD